MCPVEVEVVVQQQEVLKGVKKERFSMCKVIFQQVLVQVLLLLLTWDQSHVARQSEKH